MRASADEIGFVHAERVRFDDAEFFAEFFRKLGERRDAPPVAFHGRDEGSGLEQGAGQAAGTRPDLIDALAGEIARDRGDLARAAGGRG